MRNLLAGSVLVRLCALTALLAGCATAPDPAELAAAEARLSTPMIQPDELGRRGIGMRHGMSAEQMAELRESRVFAGQSDRQIMQTMQLMGANYAWLVDNDSKSDKRGVLVLSHGLGLAGDQSLYDNVRDSSLESPTALAFGMSMATSMHIQAALDELVLQGAREIVVIPMLSTYQNSLMRQWEFIFARREEPEYSTVPRVETPAKIILMSPLDDHPIVGRIVADHAREMSYEPDKEEVIIVGHGPVDEADNQAQLAMMENIAAFVRADRGYAAVHVATLQDDAPREVRMTNFQQIRSLIDAARAEGRKTIIVTNLLGSRIVQSSLRRGLSGAEYRFNLKGLLMHEDFIKWIEASAQETA
jgi:hypothetical protein